MKVIYLHLKSLSAPTICGSLMKLATQVTFCLFPSHTESYKQGEDKRILEEAAPECGPQSRNHVPMASEMRLEAVTAPTPDFLSEEISGWESAWKVGPASLQTSLILAGYLFGMT